VNKNNFIHGYDNNKDDSWPYSSSLHYFGTKKDRLIKNDKMILGQFLNRAEFKNFTITNALYLKNKKRR